MMIDAGRPRDIVLVVDDSPETLGLLIDALEGAGITALIARDGDAALGLLERLTPDLVLLDAMMPGIDGFETCRRMKLLPQMAVTPVVFMTGLSDAASIVQGLRAGGVDYVTKPINPDELIARVAVHLANARAIADARRAIDAMGRAVAAIAPDGRLVWASPRAMDLLGAVGGRLPDDLAARIVPWLAATVGGAVSGGQEAVLATPNRSALRLTAIGRAAGGETLVRVASEDGAAPGPLLARLLGVSEREGEVLAWLARGKSNRDIAAILGLSPRTVTKHVEQIFAKLGVENRTAAAVVCLRHLDR